MKTTRQLALAAASLAALLHLQAEVTITRHPTNQVVSLNAHVTNSVTATSTAPPITYQWYGKGALLPDETNRTLVLRSVMLDQAGEYYVVVNDAGNQPVQSDPATFTVNPTFEKITEGPLVTDVEPTESSTWWDYDNDGDLSGWMASADTVFDPVRTFEAIGDWQSVAVSRGGRQVLGAFEGGPVTLWDVQTGDVLRISKAALHPWRSRRMSAGSSPVARTTRPYSGMPSPAAWCGPSMGTPTR
jgi:hypothetical protein